MFARVVLQQRDRPARRGCASRIAASSGSSPVFQKVLDEERVERVPVLEVLKRQPKQVALTALLRMPEQAP